MGLVLRKPQLAAAVANLDKAQAILAKAKLDHERSAIRAPFTGQVSERFVDVGSLVKDNFNLFNVIATDAFWLQVSLPVQHLAWLKFPVADAATAADSGSGCAGSAVRISNQAEWPRDSYRQGCVISLLPTLNKKVKTATVIIEIKDPLALQPQNHAKPKVFINAFLQADIIGNQVTDVVQLPRQLLRSDNSVWLLADDNTLAAKPVNSIYAGRDYVLIDKGLQPGEQLITSAMKGAVPGMMLRTKAVKPGQYKSKLKAQKNQQQHKPDKVLARQGAV